MKFTYVISKVEPKKNGLGFRDVHNKVLHTACEPVNLLNGWRGVILYLNNEDNKPHRLFTSPVINIVNKSRSIEIETENTIYNLRKVSKSSYVDIGDTYDEYINFCSSVVEAVAK